MHSIQIKLAALTDYDDGADLRVEMAREMGSHDFGAVTDDWRGRFIEYFAAKQSAGEAQLVLAYDGALAVGSAIIYIVDDYRRAALGIRTGYIHAVFVKPAYRRRGIARDVMLLALAWGKAAGCKRVRLRSSDAGRPLYAALGFRPTSEMELDL